MNFFVVVNNKINLTTRLLAKLFFTKLYKSYTICQLPEVIENISRIPSACGYVGEFDKLLTLSLL